MVAAMLLFLSADEIARLHERIEHLKTGPILSFVPFVLALLAGCAWSFRQLWTTPSERPRVLGLVIGFGLLMSVGAQEILERGWNCWYLRPVRTAIEEGTELGGMLVLIYTTMPNSRGRIFTSVTAIRWPLILLAAAIAWPLAELRLRWRSKRLGHFSNWMSCVLFTSAAAMLVANWARSNPRESFHRRPSSCSARPLHSACSSIQSAITSCFRPARQFEF